MHINRAAVTNKVDPPDPFKEEIAGEGYPPVTDQACDQVKLFLREVELLTFAPGTATARVDLEPTSLEHFAGSQSRLALTAAHDRPYPGQELTEAEGFADIIVGAELQAGNAIYFILACCEHNHGHVMLLAENATDGKAVEAGEHDVQNNEIWSFSSSQFETLNTISCQENGVAFTLQVVAQGLG